MRKNVSMICLLLICTILVCTVISLRSELRSYEAYERDSLPSSFPQTEGEDKTFLEAGYAPVGVAAFGDNRLRVATGQEDEEYSKEPECRKSEDDYDVVFYWHQSENIGDWEVEIAPEGSEEWVSFTGNEQAWGGRCGSDNHGKGCSINKFYVNFAKTYGPLFKIREVSYRENEIIVWRTWRNIPIVDSDTLLWQTRQYDDDGYLSPNLQEPAVIVTKMVYCDYCPSAWIK